MSGYTYAARRRADAPAQQARGPATQAPPMSALRSGAAAPTQELLGSRVDLPGAIRAKMENSFGADLSAVQLYESQAVADAGAEAVAQGSRIAFAPGKLDFVSQSGQALLGHELSHVVSQARGEVSGSGFLNDRALEARADREGAMAAAGEQVYSGPVTGSLSDVSAAPAAGPMQAKKPPKVSEPELVTGPVEAGGKSYSSSRNAAIAEMVKNASPEQMQDPHLQDLVLGSLNGTMSSALQEHNGGTKDSAYSATWRHNGMGELATYNTMLRSLAAPHLDRFRNDQSPEENMRTASSIAESDPSLSRMIAGAKGSFAGSVHYADDTSQSDMVMSNLMLRVIVPQLATKDDQYKGLATQMMKQSNHSAADFGARDPAAQQADPLRTEGARHYMQTAARLWGAQQAAPAAEPPQKESLAARRSRLRRQHFGQ